MRLLRFARNDRLGSSNLRLGTRNDRLAVCYRIIKRQNIITVIARSLRSKIGEDEAISILPVGIEFPTVQKTETADMGIGQKQVTEK